MKELTNLLESAAAIGRHVAAQKGLTVEYGESPTEEQVGVATLHTREDMAACMYMLTEIARRQIILRRWIYFVVFLLFVVIANQH